MAENIYFNKDHVSSVQRPKGRKVNASGNRSKNSASQKWWVFGIAGSLTLMLCITVNFRAFSDLGEETSRHQELQEQIQAVMAENLSLQEHVHYLKHDPNTIEREARKFGYSQPH